MQKEKKTQVPALFKGAGIVVMCVLFFAHAGWAASSTEVGVGETDVLKALIMGSPGTILGLIGGLFGLWMYLFRQSMWGLVVICLAVMFTFFPGVFQLLYNGMNSFVSASTGSTRTEVQW